MNKIAVLIAAGSGMGADAAKSISQKMDLKLLLCLHLKKGKN